MVLELEVIVQLFQLGDFTVGRIESAVREAIFFGEKSFLFGGIKATVNSFVKMAFTMKLGQNGLDYLLVPCVGGADKIVIGELELDCKGFPDLGEIIAIRLGRLSLGNGRLLNFLAVLIKACQKKGFLTEAAAGAGDHIRNHFFISMTEM